MSKFFEYAWLLPLALILPAMVYLALRRERTDRSERLSRFGTRASIFHLAPYTSRRGPLRSTLLVTAAVLLGVAIAGPRWGLSASTSRVEGIDVVIAMDASLSMLVQDEAPSRLLKMRQVAKQLYSASPDDRFALLAFAGRSYILTPLTNDLSALSLYADNLDPSVVGQAGSSIASTIRQGVNLLSAADPDSDKAIVLMSDGEAFDDEEEIILEAAKAGQRGIELITVGFGTDKGGTIPITDQDGRHDLKRDNDGKVVISRYSAETLRSAASAANGVFVPADISDRATRIRQLLNQLKTGPRSIQTGRDLAPQYQWFVLTAFLLLIADMIIGLKGRSRYNIAKAAAILIVPLLYGCGSISRMLDVQSYNNATEKLDSQWTQASTGYKSLIKSGDSTVRFRSLFNDGFIHLVTGLDRDSSLADKQIDSTIGSLDTALVRYRSAILLNPDDVDAKWNYELALQNSSGGGGGGGSDSDPSPANQQGQSQSSSSNDAPSPSGGIDPRRAGVILDNIEREERAVQGKRQERNVPQPPPSGKDW